MNNNKKKIFPLIIFIQHVKLYKTPAMFSSLSLFGTNFKLVLINNYFFYKSVVNYYWIKGYLFEINCY